MSDQCPSEKKNETKAEARPPMMPKAFASTSLASHMERHLRHLLPHDVHHRHQDSTEARYVRQLDLEPFLEFTDHLHRTIMLALSLLNISLTRRNAAIYHHHPSRVVQRLSRWAVGILLGDALPGFSQSTAQLCHWFQKLCQGCSWKSRWKKSLDVLTQSIPPIFI